MYTLVTVLSVHIVLIGEEKKEFTRKLTIKPAPNPNRKQNDECNPDISVILEEQMNSRKLTAKEAFFYGSKQ